MLIIIYHSIFYFITLRVIAADRFGRLPQNDGIPLRQRRLTDDPCLVNGSNINDDCSIFKDKHKVFSEKYDDITKQSSMAIDCSISSPGNSSSETKLNTLEYWYAVEASETKVESWLRALEEEIYQVAFKKMSFCIVSGETQIRGSLQGDSETKPGILSVTSMPYDDNRLDVPCPGVLIKEGMSCVVIQGRMRILTRAYDDLSLTIAAMLDTIKNSMSPETALFAGISTVKNVTYLGTTQSEIKNWVISSVVLPINTDIEPEEKDDDGGGFLYIILLGIFLILALLLLLFVQRRRPKYFFHLADDFSIDGNSDTEEFNNLKAPVDPKNIKGNIILAADYDSEETEETMNVPSLVAANFKELDAEHSGINVHKCTSSTCKICTMIGYKDVAMVDFKRVTNFEKCIPCLVPK